MPNDRDALLHRLQYLKLNFFLENYQDLAQQAVDKHHDPIHFLSALVEGEALLRTERSNQRRIRLARFPVLKTLDQFQWSWPKNINRLAVQHLLRLGSSKTMPMSSFLEVSV